MQQVKQTLKKNFYNSFCDANLTALNCFLPSEESQQLLSEESFSNEELTALVKFTLALNSLAGVGKVNLKAHSAEVLQYFEEFGLEGKVILDQNGLSSIRTKDFVGGRVVAYIDSLLDEDEKSLSEISDLCGKMKIPVIIGFGRTLEEVGSLSSRYKLSPARVLEDFGFLDRQCSLLGCNFIDKDDLDIIASYGGEIILTPRSDMMMGRGAVNLYSIENKGISYHFGSEICPIIDMASEVEIARGNTANLLYERGLIKAENLLEAILIDGENNEKNFLVPLENSFKMICQEHDSEELKKFYDLKTQIEKIIKEKIWKS